MERRRPGREARALLKTIDQAVKDGRMHDSIPLRNTLSKGRVTRGQVDQARKDMGHQWTAADDFLRGQR